MKKLRIHYFQHVSFEGLGCIGEWIIQKGHQLSYTKFYDDEALPELADIDWLIVLGGPMGVYDQDIYPWLEYETKFVKKAIENGKTVIGICLGAQLIANALGAKVYPNAYKEIGWFDISMTRNALDSKIFKGFKEKFKVFHWHGDTFDLPDGAQNLFSSDACLNQCFLYKSNVLGIQFHLELTHESLKEMISNGLHELQAGDFIQTEADLLNYKDLIVNNNELMYKILERL